MGLTAHDNVSCIRISWIIFLIMKYKCCWNSASSYIGIVHVVLGECLSIWWCTNFGSECKKLFVVHLPGGQYFEVPRNLKLIAVPLFELNDNVQANRALEKVKSFGFNPSICIKKNSFKAASVLPWTASDFVITFQQKTSLFPISMKIVKALLTSPHLACISSKAVPTTTPLPTETNLSSRSLSTCRIQVHLDGSRQTRQKPK
ncbi:hypothetical protein Ancab_009652 [Ancistrocladus abbreviatus]